MAGLTGVYLGFLGYHAPAINAGSIAAVAAADTTGHTGARSPAAGGQAGSGGASRAAGTTTPAGGAKTAAAGTRTKAATPAKGPLLSSTRWWPYAHQLYPGSPSASTRVALSGFRVTFSKATGGLERVRVDTGRAKPQTATFRRTDRLYMIEGGMGDDGFHQDTNFGDDAFVLTDAGGHIVGK